MENCRLNFRITCCSGSVAYCKADYSEKDKDCGGISNNPQRAGRAGIPGVPAERGIGEQDLFLG